MVAGVMMHRAMLLLVGFFTPFHSGASEKVNGFAGGVGAHISHDDNLFKTSDMAQADELLSLAPYLSWQGSNGKHDLELQYQGTMSKFKERSELDYYRHTTQLKGVLGHSSRLKTSLSASYLQGAELPGSTDDIGRELDEFNEVSQGSVGGAIYYGSYRSTGQIVVSLKRDKNRFHNNDQSYRDHSKTLGGLSFFYRIAPNSRLTLEADLVDYDYTPSAGSSDLSSRQSLLLAGYEWRLSGQTSGSLKLGYQRKQYDDATKEDVSGLSYRLEMDWKPNPHTLFELEAYRATTESALQDTGSFIRHSIKGGLTHELSARTHLDLGVSYGSDDLIYDEGRIYKRYQLNLGMTHSLRHWLEATVSYQRSVRDDSEGLADFAANQMTVGVAAKFP